MKIRKSQIKNLIEEVIKEGKWSYKTNVPRQKDKDGKLPPLPPERQHNTWMIQFTKILVGMDKKFAGNYAIDRKFASNLEKNKAMSPDEAAKVYFKKFGNK